MTQVIYVSIFKKNGEKFIPVESKTIEQLPYEVVSGVGDDISVDGKSYVIGNIEYLYGGDTLVSRMFYVYNKQSKEVF